MYKAKAPETQDAPDWWKTAIGERPGKADEEVGGSRSSLRQRARSHVGLLVSGTALFVALGPGIFGRIPDPFAYAPITAPSSGQVVPVVPLAVATLLPLAVLGCLLVPRLRPAVPWLGLLTVNATAFAFLAFAGIAAYHGLNQGWSWLMTAAYGLTGLAIVMGSVGLRPVPHIPIGAIAAGLAYVAALSAALNAWGWDIKMIVLLLPGLALVGFGALLWRRYGLTAKWFEPGLTS